MPLAWYGGFRIFDLYGGLSKEEQKSMVGFNRLYERVKWEKASTKWRDLQSKNEAKSYIFHERYPKMN